MKLNVDNDKDSGIDGDYVQAVSAQLGAVMQLFGLQMVKLDVRRTPRTAVPIVTDAQPFGFADPSVVSTSIAVATPIAHLAAAAGIIGLSITDVSEEESNSMSSIWNKLPKQSDLPARLAPPPDLKPDMEPIEVDL